MYTKTNQLLRTGYTFLICLITYCVPAQNISTIAGGGATTIANGIAATSADLGAIHGMDVDAAGNLYVATVNKHYILRINASDGTITILAGDGVSASTGDGALATNSQVTTPRGLFLDNNNNIYFVEGGTSKRIRKIDNATGNISTVAGGGASDPGDGGQATAAALNDPFFVYVDNDNGDIYFTEFNGNKVRKVNGTTGVLSTIAGNGTGTSTGDAGLATAATVNKPLGIYLDAAKNIYFAEFSGHRIRKINASDGKINTIVGTGTGSSTGDGAAASSATINGPTGIHIDITGNLYIAEFSGNRVRKVTAGSNIINTIAGGGASNPGDGGLATDAVVALPFGLEIDDKGDMYTPEFSAGKIRKVSYPDINVKTTSDITTGSIYNFSATTVGNSSGPVTFTVENKGSGNLTLTGTAGSLALLGGTNPGDFSVSQATLTSPIAQSTSKTFTITFSPTAAGTRNATLVINSNDPNENPYTIFLVGVSCNSINSGSIGSAQTICSGETPALLTSTAAASGGNGSFTFKWQSSTDGTNFSDIGGALSTTYQPPALTQNTYYRRTAISGGGCGSANSEKVLITVTTKKMPSVTVTASSTTLCNNNTITFTAVPTNGGNSPSYQWKLNGGNIGGATNATYVTNTLNDGDKISVVLTSSESCVTSSTATSNEVTLNNGSPITPSVSISASATTICSGTSVTFTATATNGGGTPTYQWKLNGNDISGATNATFSSSSLNNGDKISVVLTTSETCVTSSTATSSETTVTVNAKQTPSVSITSDDADNTITNGTKVTFTATPTNGGSTPTYQWKLNGVDINGATSSTFEKSDLSNGDKVSVTLTSSETCITSNTATSNEITITVSSNGVTALPNQPAQARLDVFPNPGIHQVVLKVTGKASNQIHATVFDRLGKAVTTHQGQLKQGLFVIPVKSLPKGAYLLKIRLGNETIVKRLLKE